jgi:hypothetical protein
MSSGRKFSNIEQEDTSMPFIDEEIAYIRSQPHGT